MKALFIVCLFQLLLFGHSSAQKESEPIPEVKNWPVTVEERIFGLMTIWSEVKYGFPYPEKLKALNWDKNVRECIPRVIQADDEESYFKTLMELTTRLEDSHTSVLPPWGYFKPGYDFPALEIQVIEDRFYISRVGENEDLQSQQITPGTEILKIENQPIRDFFEDQVLKLYTQGSEQATNAILVLYLLYGPKNEKVHLKIKRIDGAETEVALLRNSTCLDGSSFVYPFVYNTFVASTIEVKWFKESILYIKIPSFENEQIAKDFQTLIDTVDISKIKGMILDVRNNMGGSNRNSDKIVKCLIAESVSSPLMHYPHHIAAFKAWGKDDVWDVSKNMIEPRKGKKYLGPLVLLTGPVSASSAEDLIIELKTADRATIIGRRTAGGAGNTLEFELPGGGTFRMATFKATYPDGREYVGKGIVPDIEIHLTLNDIIEGNDRVLRKGIETLELVSK